MIDHSLAKMLGLRFRPLVKGYSVGFFEWAWEWILWLMQLAKPENLRQIVNLGGPWWMSYAILFAIIFSETGLLVGFFLPGDSLLFAAGFLASQGVFSYWILVSSLLVAAIIGDAVNYYLGKQLGDQVFEKGRIRFVKHSHLVAAKAFYDRHGGKAIILARFAPLVRTFTPFVAGVAEMHYPRFALYNVIGAVAWVFSMTTAGYWLGQHPFISKHFELVVLTIVLLSILPILIGVLNSWRASRRKIVEVSQPAVVEEVNAP